MRTRAAVALIACACASAAFGGHVRMDGSVGRAGLINRVDALDGTPQYTIAASLGKQAGGNLFHSFAQLSISQNERLVFNGPPSVRNVLARVTGVLTQP